MNNSAIYDRFIDMFLESGEDYEPYGATAPDGNMPRQMERSWGPDCGEAGPLMTGPLETDH